MTEAWTTARAGLATRGPDPERPGQMALRDNQKN